MPHYPTLDYKAVLKTIPKPNGMTDAEWDTYACTLAKSSLFLATTEEAKVYKRILNSLLPLATGEVAVNDEGETYYKTPTKTAWRDQVRDILEEEGLFDPSVETGEDYNNDVTNIGAVARLELIVETVTKSAACRAQYDREMSPTALAYWPAWRFCRFPGAKDPRPLHVANEGVVRLKSDLHYWADEQNAPEIGGFGVPYGPWGYNSYMYTEQVSFAECQRLGLVPAGADPKEFAELQRQRIQTYYNATGGGVLTGYTPEEYPADNAAVPPEPSWLVTPPLQAPTKRLSQGLRNKLLKRLQQIDSGAKPNPDGSASLVMPGGLLPPASPAPQPTWQAQSPLEEHLSPYGADREGIRIRAYKTQADIDAQIRRINDKIEARATKVAKELHAYRKIVRSQYKLRLLRRQYDNYHRALKVNGLLLRDDYYKLTPDGTLPEWPFVNTPKQGFPPDAYYGISMVRMLIPKRYLGGKMHNRYTTGLRAYMCRYAPRRGDPIVPHHYEIHCNYLYSQPHSWAHEYTHSVEMESGWINDSLRLIMQQAPHERLTRYRQGEWLLADKWAERGIEPYLGKLYMERSKYDPAMTADDLIKLDYIHATEVMSQTMSHMVDNPISTLRNAKLLIDHILACIAKS
jgi:hypothetical protein